VEEAARGTGDARAAAGRLLLLATSASYRAGAFLDAARTLGVEVVIGSDRPQALAGFNPEGHLTLDFLAPGRSVEAIVHHAERTPIAAVIAADDDGVILAALAAGRLGLRHHPAEAARAARHKRDARAAFAAAGMPGPRVSAWPVDGDPARAAAAGPYPCVLKPLALSASRGVIRADDPAAFVAAFARIAALLARPEVAAAAEAVGGREAARTILVEEYLEGPEVALEGLMEDGALRTLALFDKPDPLEGPIFEETIYVTPSRLDRARRHAVHDEVARGAAALGLAEGPIHAELRLGRATPVVLEIAPRSIGGLCSRALRFTGGVSLEALILMRALGRDTRGIEREPAASGVMMIPIPRGGVLRGVEGREAALAVPGVEDVRITIAPGTRVVPLPEGARYLGFVFARRATPAEAEAALRAAHAALNIDIV
jgi:biotin carboxylase